MRRALVLTALLCACSGSEEPQTRPARSEEAAESEAEGEGEAEGASEAEGEGEAEGASEAEGEHHDETVQREASESEVEPGSDPITLQFAWPAPATADVRVVSEHDFSGARVSATYRYRLAVSREAGAYHLSRTDITLEAHEGDASLRLGNVLAQDVTQHGGDVRIAADGSRIRATSGFDPIESAARAVLAHANIDDAVVDAILVLDREGWQALATVDLDSVVHEWRGRTVRLGEIEHAEALPGVEATRVLRAVNVPCGEDGPSTCVELVRMEQGVSSHGHVEHVYTLVADPTTLRPYRFEHEGRTVDTSRALDYADDWVTTFVWN